MKYNDPYTRGEGVKNMIISITDAAKEAIAEQNADGKKVRVYVAGVG